MGNVNQAYFDRVRFILQNDNLGSLIIEEPIGWNSDEKELTRHKDFHGIFPKFSNNLKFKGQAKDYLQTLYDVYGINVQVRLVKDEKHPKTDEWTRSYSGYLDMSTYKLSNNKIDLKFNSGGLEMELKARESEAIEITRTTTLDGLPLNDLPINQIELDGRRIFLKSIFQVKDSDNEVFMHIYSDAGNTRSKCESIPLRLINKSHEEAHSVIINSEHGENQGTTGAMLFANSEVDRNLRVKFNLKFLYSLVRREGVSWSNFKVRLSKYGNGVNYDLIETIELLSNNGGVNYNGQSFDINFDDNVSLLAGQSLALEFFIKADFRITTHGENFDVRCKNIKCDLTIEEDSFFEKSISNCVLPHEVAERLIEVYTNKKVLKSDVLGRTDIGYPADGKASLLGLAHGFWIRQFDNSDEVFRPLTTSLKEFMESFSATHNLGLGIENDGFKEFVRIEDLSYFYNRNTTIKLPYQVKNVERTIAADYYYSSLELGFEKGGDYEEAFGLVEYNGSSKFATTIKRIKNAYSKLSKYRGDSYGAEFARRKPKLTHGTEDTRYDTDVFQFDMKRDSLSTIFKLRKWQDDFEQAPTGTFSPDTAYNLRLSPLNCMLRHGWSIASGLTKYLSDYVRYTSSSANSSLSTKYRTDSDYLLDPLHSVANGNEYAENGNIINAELGRPRFVPEFIEFEHEVTFEINQLLMGSKTILGKKIPNIYGCVEFTNENGEQEKGFLMNLKPNGKSKWKLLKAYS